MDSTKEHRCLSLCTGYGGLELGLRRAWPNVRTVAYVEVEAFACANLVAKMEAGSLDAAPVWTDIKTFDASSFRDRIHIVTAGYPCQPFSFAGKRQGGIDPRHLWPDIARIIKTVRPVWVFLENVPGLLSGRTLDNRPDLQRHLANLYELRKISPTARLRWYLQEHRRRLTEFFLRTEGIPAYASVYFGLRDLGYRVEAGLFTAAEVGAPHKRQRLFILAGPIGNGCGGSLRQTGQGPGGAQQRTDADGQGIGNGRKRTPRELADTECPEPREGNRQEPSAKSGGDRFTINHCPARPGPQQYEWEEPRIVDNAQHRRYEPKKGQIQTGRNGVKYTDKGQAKPKLGRAADGTAGRVDRLRLLGNGVVPQQAEKAFRNLMECFIST